MDGHKWIQTHQGRHPSKSSEEYRGQQQTWLQYMEKLIWNSEFQKDPALFNKDRELAEANIGVENQILLKKQGIYFLYIFSCGSLYCHKDGSTVNFNPDMLVEDKTSILAMGHCFSPVPIKSMPISKQRARLRTKCKGGYIAEEGRFVCDNPTCQHCISCTCKRKMCKVRGRKCLWLLNKERMELALDHVKKVFDDESMDVVEKFAFLRSMTDRLIPNVESCSEWLQQLSKLCDPQGMAISESECDEVVSWIRNYQSLDCSARL